MAEYQLYDPSGVFKFHRGLSIFCFIHHTALRSLLSSLAMCRINRARGAQPRNPSRQNGDYDFPFHCDGLLSQGCSATSLHSFQRDFLHLLAPSSVLQNPSMHIDLRLPHPRPITTLLPSPCFASIAHMPRSRAILQDAMGLRRLAHREDPRWQRELPKDVVARGARGSVPQ